jgi:ferric-dicitrate binding protein FerR (iron transport regulator)
MIEMKREELIKKWLDNELSAQEFEDFKSLDDYKELVKVSDGIQQLELPDYAITDEFLKLKQTMNLQSEKATTPWVKYVIQIAAVLVIGLGVYHFTFNSDDQFSTLIAEKTTLELPDASEVVLNAKSTLSYNKRNWDSDREISLNGEAYFKVSKGKKFTVITPSGSVTVLGTQFNVKQRDNLFEVICYEGSVMVEYDTKTEVLKPGDNFLIIDGNYIAKEKETASNPSWINNESYFSSMPFEFVINEFERQYNLSIELQDIDLEQRFTGSFVHNDKTLALKSITLPLNLTYSLKDHSTIVLSRE